MHSRLLLVLLAVSALLAPAAHAANPDDLLEPEKAFRFSARAIDAATLEVRYQIADGYYMYREKFRFTAEPADIKLGKAAFPDGKVKQDEFFGRVETYRKDVTIRMARV